MLLSKVSMSRICHVCLERKVHAVMALRSGKGLRTLGFGIGFRAFGFRLYDPGFKVAVEKVCCRS